MGSPYVKIIKDLCDEASAFDSNRSFGERWHYVRRGDAPPHDDFYLVRGVEYIRQIMKGSEDFNAIVRGRCADDESYGDVLRATYVL